MGYHEKRKRHQTSANEHRHQERVERKATNKSDPKVITELVHIVRVYDPTTNETHFSGYVFKDNPQPLSTIQDYSSARRPPLSGQFHNILSARDTAELGKTIAERNMHERVHYQHAQENGPRKVIKKIPGYFAWSKPEEIVVYEAAPPMSVKRSFYDWRMPYNDLQQLQKTVSKGRIASLLRPAEQASTLRSIIANTHNV